MTTGEAIMMLRKQRHMTKVELAKLTGLHRNYISTVEKDGGDPTLSVLVKIFRELGFEIKIAYY